MPSGTYTDPQSVHNPATNTAPPASWGDTVRDDLQYLHQRGPYICTSATRPASPTEGDFIYETDTNKVMVYGDAAWWSVGISSNLITTTTPTLTQSGAVTKTVSRSSYRVLGGVCEWWFRIDVTGSGTVGNIVTLTTPVTSAFNNFEIIGTASIYDASAVTVDSGSIVQQSTTTISFLTDDATSSAWGQTPSIALASGDVIRGHCRFLVSTAA